MKASPLFLGLVCCLTFVAPAAAGPKEKILYAFTGGIDGAGPSNGLIIDDAGNLYGVTTAGGNTGCLEGCGVVYELSPGANGSWTETVLHSFTPGTDGSFPKSRLLLDQKGNLYGTTYAGGSTRGGTCSGVGCGTVFELTPNRDGTWKEKILHSFSGPDGAAPFAGVVMDGKGILYGTADIGGKYGYGGGKVGYGVVYKLTPKANGQWTETTIHNFTNGKDGAGACCSLVFDKSGNLFSVAGGGHRRDGVVFEMMPQQNGGWQEKVAYNFNRPQLGADDPTFDESGNLIVALDLQVETDLILKLTPSGGQWTETVLHRFMGKNGIYRGGNYPSGNFVFDSQGNIYGVTAEGGAYAYGVVFELMQNNGKWTERVLHTFLKGQDGAYPWGGLVFDKAGNLYGVTGSGGQGGAGTVFEITP